jgi:hypothetical protein
MTPNEDADGGPGGLPSEHAIHRDGVISKYQVPIFSAVCAYFLAGLLIFLGIIRSELTLIIVGAVVAALGTAVLAYVLTTMRRGVRRVLLTGAGIEWEDDGTAHEKAWEDVREVYYKEVITRGDRITHLRVVFADGSEMKADNRLSKYKSLCQSVLSASSGALLERKRRDLAAGRAEFGPITLHADGVEAKGERKGWGELEQWTIHNGRIYVISTRPGDRYGWELTLYDVPNYPVLFQLLQEAWQRPTPAAASIPFGGGRRASGQ